MHNNNGAPTTEKVTYRLDPVVRDWLRNEANRQTQEQRRTITEGRIIEQLVFERDPKLKRILEGLNNGKS